MARRARAERLPCLRLSFAASPRSEEKEKELLEQTRARERAEAQLGEAAGLFEEAKAGRVGRS